MSHSTTSIAELPQASGIQNLRPSVQVAHMSHIQEPMQSLPVSTQQISNEFYGHISAQPQYPQQTQHVADDDQLNYKPINVHPNPYGTPQVTPEGLPLPESSPQRNQNPLQQQQQHIYSVENMPQQSLPSRDIPMNTLEYQQDHQIKPNHIPSVKLTSDYIRNYEKENEEELKLHKQRKYRQETAHETISNIQIPILVAVLYFLFSMPIVSTFLRKHLTFLKIYNEDGNFNLTGLIFKSVAFGSMFYFMNSISNKISDL